MKYWWKINIYEIQTILYWILGVLILNGSGHWSGWVAIGYGWFVFTCTIIYTIAKRKELMDAFKVAEKELEEIKL